MSEVDMQIAHNISRDEFGGKFPMEIGSIYEINPASVKASDAGNGQKLYLEEVEKYGKKYCSYTASGREAIILALRSLEQRRPDIPKRCLLPAYMCDTVFFPFKRAGWEIHFYHINRELAAEEERLRRQIEQVRPGLLFIHPYYGVDTWKQMRSLLLEWKEQGICIMEDVTQSYYLEEAGMEADYVIGSLRKWYPVPDGGFVASNESLLPEDWEEAESYTKRRMEVAVKKWEYLNGQGDAERKRELKAEFLKKNREMEEELDQYDGVRKLSKEAVWMLQEVEEEEAKRCRAANYWYLYENLRGKMSFAPILESKEVKTGKEGEIRSRQAAPLYFPIYVQQREELQRFLGTRDIYAPVLWPVGTENESCLSEDERYIYEHMLALPMDQRYGREEMRRIVEVMEEYECQKIEKL